MLKIKYKGYTISQAENNHIMIAKDNQMLFHSSCTKKLTEEELEQQVNLYLKLVECVEDELRTIYNKY